MNFSVTMSRLQIGIADGAERVEDGGFGDSHALHRINSAVLVLERAGGTGADARLRGFRRDR